MNNFGVHNAKNKDRKNSLSSDEEDILYRPEKMIENRKQRFFMSFNNADSCYKEKVQDNWNKLNYIVCRSKGSEYRKFLKKIYEMKSFQEKIDSNAKRRVLRTISTTRRAPLIGVQQQVKQVPQPQLSKGPSRKSSESPPRFKKTSSNVQQSAEQMMKRMSSIKKGNVTFNFRINEEESIEDEDIEIQDLHQYDSSEDESKGNYKRKQPKAMAEAALRMSLLRRDQRLTKILKQEPILHAFEPDDMDESKPKLTKIESLRVEEIVMKNSPKYHSLRQSKVEKEVAPKRVSQAMTQSTSLSHQKPMYQTFQFGKDHDYLTSQNGDQKTGMTINTEELLSSNGDLGEGSSIIGLGHTIQLGLQSAQVRRAQTSEKKFRKYQQKSRSYYKQQESLYGSFQLDSAIGSLKQRFQEELVKMNAKKKHQRELAESGNLELKKKKLISGTSKT